ncbi:MAG TPA: BlaI/MecI/CopY family transcriptional regulator [Candidatus Hydrogenedentes bacterium]|nr:BlaI/MecI/CopY family transcriptional regulator [Candidatus Hydrogenedentota bacterium]HPG68654.1 BlaI/MecI/CopY family transcriptional regulator [Candidatus Hydrogenedentota bacterium]
MARRKSDESLPELSRLEQEIMNVVWELGECTSIEVIVAHAPKRALAKTTIRTVLANLRKKGYIELVPSIERGYRLRPAIPREAVAQRSLKSLVATLFAGAPHHAIAYLIGENDIDETDLEEIQRMIEARKKK